MKKWFKKIDRAENIANELYIAAVSQARRPEFYVEYGVPDTVDGRFELITLHVYLLLRPLDKLARSEVDVAVSAHARKSAQSLFDIMFGDMDRSLREMGVSDISVGKRVKQMVRAFYGRVVAYDEGLAGSDEVLQGALERNLFGTVQPSKSELIAMAKYFRCQADFLAAASERDINSGNLKFAPIRGKNIDP